MSDITSNNENKTAIKNPENPPARVRIADLSLLLVAVLWGAGFVAVEFSIKSGMPASLILALRFAIGAIIVFVLKFKTVLKMTKEELINGSIAGALLFFSFFMQTIGQSRTGVSSSAFITAVYVVIVPFIMWAVKRKPPRLKMFVLVFTTLIGVIILTYKKDLSLFTFGSGDIYLVLCAIGFAAHIVFLGVRTRHLNPTRITFLQLLVSAMLGVALFFMTEQPMTLVIDWNTGLPAILYVGIFSTAVCYFMQTWAQTMTNPSKAAIIMSAESLFGPLFAIVIGLEVFRLNIVIGGIIIMGSVALSEIEFKKMKQRA